MSVPQASALNDAPPNKTFNARRATPTTAQDALRQRTCDEPEDEGVGARGGGSRGEAGGGCGAQRTTGGEVGVRPQRGVQGMRAVGGGAAAPDGSDGASAEKVLKLKETRNQ